MAKPQVLMSRRDVVRLLEIDEDFLTTLEHEEIVCCEQPGQFSAGTVERIRVCRTLHTELGVNYAGLEVALQLLDTLRAERLQFREVLHWLRQEVTARRRLR